MAAGGGQLHENSRSKMAFTHIDASSFRTVVPKFFDTNVAALTLLMDNRVHVR